MGGNRSNGLKTRVEERSQQKVQRRIKFESKRVSDRRKGEAEERPVEKLCHLSCCDSSGLTAHKSPSISQLCDMPSSLPLFIFIPDAYIRLPEAQRPLSLKHCVCGSRSLEVPTGSARSVFGRRQKCTHARVCQRSSFPCQNQSRAPFFFFFSTVKPPQCCVLPQITSDVTSLSTVYVCEIQRWPDGVY